MAEVERFVVFCVRRLPEDGTPVPKHVGAGTYHLLCVMFCNLLVG